MFLVARAVKGYISLARSAAMCEHYMTDFRVIFRYIKYRSYIKCHVRVCVM